MLLVGISQGQSFDRTIQGSTLSLPEKSLEGFATKMDFGADDLKLGWWKYAKRFALPLNQRTHYEVTIPATNDSRKVVIYTMVGDESNKPYSFKLALPTDGMSEEDKKKYSAQAKAMLLDFKRWYYLRHYEEKLSALEKEFGRSSSRNWDEWMRFVERRREIIERMKEI